MPTLKSELGKLWKEYNALVESNELSMYDYTKHTDYFDVPSAEGFFKWLTDGAPYSLEEVIEGSRNEG